MLTRLLNGLCVFSCLLGLCACASTIPTGAVSPSQHLGVVAAAPHGFSLPAPQQLGALLPAAPRRASFVPADLLRAGASFNPLLPHNKVTAAASGAHFTPAWAGQSAPPSGLAYAMYDFRIPGFNLNPSIEYSWSATPPDFSKVYIGLANWKKDRWDWYRAEADGRSDFASLSQYFDFGDDILVTVLMTGKAPAELDSLRIASIPPQVQLTESVTHGFIPLTVDFDATGSTDADGSIAEYRWDPDGDGTFEASSGKTPTFEHIYQQKSDLHPAVKVIDNDGVSTVQALDLGAFGTSILSLGAPATQEYWNMAVPLPDGKLFLVGRRVDQSQNIGRIVVSRLSPNGGFDFVREWEGGVDDDQLEDAKLGSDGFIYGCGGTLPTGLLQKWSTDGELIWTKDITGTDSMILSNIGLQGNLILASGSMLLPTFSYAPGILCTDQDGAVQWCKVLPAVRACGFSDLATHESIQVGASFVDCVGDFSPVAGQSDCGFFAKFGVDGSLQACKLGGGDTATYAYGLNVSGLIQLSTYISGAKYDGSKYDAFVSKVGGSSVLISDAPYSLAHPVARLNRGGLSLALERNDSISSQSGALAVVNLDIGLNLLSGTLLDAGTQGSGELLGVNSVDGKVMILLGQQFGKLPTLSNLDVTVSPASLTWTDYTPTVENPACNALNGNLEVNDLNNYSLNRELDSDGFVYIVQ